MFIDIRYFLGYVTAIIIASYSAASVLAFLLNANPMVMLLSTSACFLLNLLLFWRSFARESSQQATLFSAKIATLFSSLVIYISSYYAFLSLTQTTIIAAALLSPLLIHVLSLFTAMGFYQLYIEDCNELIVNFSLKHFSASHHLAWLLPLSLSLFLPLSFTIPLIGFQFSLIIVRHNYQASLAILLGFASISSSLFGYGAYFSLFYAALPVWLTPIAYLATQLGLLSLIINDCLYSVQQANTKPSPQSVKYYVLLLLAGLNAFANSQLSSGGKGVLDFFAVIGGGLSFMTMKNNLSDIFYEATPQAPFHQDTSQVLLLFLFNSLMVISGAHFLSKHAPFAYFKIRKIFQQTILNIPMKYYVLAGGLYGHITLYQASSFYQTGNVNKKDRAKARLAPLPTHHPEGNQTHLSHDY